MKRLTDEQIEDILQGSASEPEEMDERDRRYLSRMRAVRRRLRSSFASVTAGDNLKNRVLSAIRAERGKASGRRRRVYRTMRIFVPLAAAAAVLIAAGIIPLFNTGGPEPAMAARSELAKIHLRHKGIDRTDHACACKCKDMNKASAWLRKKLGSDIVIPDCCNEVHLLVACDMEKFCGRNVGCYVLQTQSGKIVSVVVTPDSPDDMDLKHKGRRNGRDLWWCKYKTCRIAAFRLNGLTYCIVGEVPHEELFKIVDHILAIAKG